MIDYKDPGLYLQNKLSITELLFVHREGFPERGRTVSMADLGSDIMTEGSGILFRVAQGVPLDLTPILFHDHRRLLMCELGYSGMFYFHLRKGKEVVHNLSIPALHRMIRSKHLKLSGYEVLVALPLA